MTNLCPGGGPSGPKPQVDPVVAVGTVALSAFVSALGFPELVDLIAISAGFLSLDVANYCTTDPPPDPMLTQQDIQDASNFANPVAQLAAGRRFTQWVLSQYWYKICECTGGSTPGPPAPSNPGPLGTNTGLPSGTVGANCWDQSSQQTWNTFTSGQPSFRGSMPPITATGTTTGVTLAAVPNPRPVSLMVNATWTVSGGTGAQYDVTLTFYDATGAAISTVGTGTPYTNAGAPATFSAPVPANAAMWDVFINPIGSAQAWDPVTGTVEFILYCAGQSPTGLNTPCCPPDPLVELKLNQIVGILQYLLENQPVSNTGPYTPTTTHSGLSGQGFINIAPASRAIRVDVTSSLTNWPSNQQLPTYYYSLGFVTPSAVGTPLRGQRLIYNGQIFSWPTYTDRIDYTFEPGVTCDLVELA